MWKVSLKIIFLFLSCVTYANGAELQCEYQSKVGYFDGFEGPVYYCNIINNGIFTGERVTIDSVVGEHLPGYTIEDVKGIRFYGISSVNYFPRNLENIFEDLKVIILESTNLHEISQEDLKVFRKLKNLNLFDNKIATLDENLFHFNPELRALYLNYNEITHIDPNVFDNLNDIKTLHLANNKCRNDLSNSASRSEVLQLIERVRNGECSTVNGLLMKKEVREQPIVKTLMKLANEEFSTQNEGIQRNLTSANKETSILLQHVSEKLEKTEKINQENEEEIKTCEESNYNLNKTNEDLIQDLSELREQTKNDSCNIQEMTTTNENLITDSNEITNKILNVKLLELNDKMNELNEKYTNLLSAKLIDSEKTVRMQNELIKNINKVNIADQSQADNGQEKSTGSVGGVVNVYFGNNNPPITLLN